MRWDVKTDAQSVSPVDQGKALVFGGPGGREERSLLGAGSGSNEVLRLAPSPVPLAHARPIALQGMSGMGKLILIVTWLGVLLFSWRLVRAMLEGKHFASGNAAASHLAASLPSGAAVPASGR